MQVWFMKVLDFRRRWTWLHKQYDYGGRKVNSGCRLSDLRKWVWKTHCYFLPSPYSVISTLSAHSSSFFRVIEDYSCPLLLINLITFKYHFAYFGDKGTGLFPLYRLPTFPKCFKLRHNVSYCFALFQYF